MSGYVVSIGEALIDLIEDRSQGVLRPVPGGSVLNVAVGVARLGVRSEFLGSFGGDGFADMLRSFLKQNQVGHLGRSTAICPHLWRSPPSWALIRVLPSMELRRRTDCFGPRIWTKASSKGRP